MTTIGEALVAQLDARGVEIVFGIPGVWGGIGFDGLALSSVMTQTGVAVFLVSKLHKMDVTAAPKLPELRPSWATTCCPSSN